MKFKKFYVLLFLVFNISSISIFANNLNNTEEEMIEDNLQESEFTQETEVTQESEFTQETEEENSTTESSTISNSSNNSSSVSNFSISENLNLFSNRNIGDKYRLIGVPYSSSLDHYPNTYGYGVVSIYQSLDNRNLYAIEMKSNIKGAKASTFEKYVVTDLSWNISSNSSRVKVVDWSPAGTTIAKKEEYLLVLILA